MAAFLLHPHVTEFLDVVMRDRSIELRLEEVEIAAGSPFVGQSLRQAKVRDRTGALVLALRHVDGTMLTNPDPDTKLVVGSILIAIGTDEQLRVARRGGRRQRAGARSWRWRVGVAVTALQGHRRNPRSRRGQPRPAPRCLLSAMTSSRVW